MHLSCLKPSAAIQKHLREPANRIARPSVSTLFRLTLQGTAVKGHVMHSLHDIKTSLPWPCHMPLAGNEPGSFAEGTITKRLPAILQSTANDVIVLASTANDQMREKVSAGFGIHEHSYLFTLKTWNWSVGIVILDVVLALQANHIRGMSF